MEKNKRKDKLSSILILLATAVLTGASSYFYGNTLYEIIRIVLLVILMAGMTVFAIEISKIHKLFRFDNEENFWRFLIIYLIFLVGSVLFPLLPASGWPFLAVFVGLLLFSNQIIAVCSGSTLLMITVLLGKIYTIESFLVYFVAGLTAVFLFSCINESFKVGIPLCMSILIQFVCLCIQEVLMVNETLHIEMFLIPFANILVCLILMLIILKIFSFAIIYRNQDLYMDINDPECPLLVELKNYSKDEYYHAVHTAYLCDRIAKKLDLDDNAAKAAGYYHKISLLKGDNNWENTSMVLEEYNFPEKVREILKEYLDEKERIVSKETVILLFSDTVISSIHYLFSKDKTAQLDYEKLIQAVFKKKEESGLIKYSQITLQELEEMKKILTEEKLYYDFLR